MTINCKNCTNTYEGKFCNTCGQSASTGDINFKSIVHEIQHGVFHLDKGILYTTRKLLYRPGHAIKDYINGKRINHSKPFAYVLILCTIYGILLHYSDNTTVRETISIAIKEPGKKATAVSGKWLFKGIDWLKNHYAYTTLIMMPIVSFASFLAFYKTKYNFFQHLILNSFIAGFRTFVFLIIVLPLHYILKDPDLIDSIEIIKYVIIILLPFWVYAQFFDSIKLTTRILLTLLNYVLFSILFAGLALLFISLAI